MINKIFHECDIKNGNIYNLFLCSLNSFDTTQPITLFDAKSRQGRELNVLGGNEYVISDVNNFNKYSGAYCDCTGLVMVGKTKKDNSEISLLTHQTPQNFYDGNIAQFETHLEKRLGFMLENCIFDSIDSVIFGGHLLHSNYNLQIEKLDFIFKKYNITFENNIGPNLLIDQGPTRVYFENKSRSLHIFWPKQPI